MKILWTLSSVGLGHLMRDISIIEKILEISNLNIDLLVPKPALDKVPDKLNLIPESYKLKGSGNAYYKVFKDCKDKFDLINFIKEDSKHYKHDFKVTIDLINTKDYSMLIGDEAFWLLSGFGMKWAKKRIPFIYITDFIGMKAMDDSIRNKMYVWFKNMQFAMTGNIPDLSIFIGSPEEIPNERFGFLLPNQRKWAKKYYNFEKPILKMDSKVGYDKIDLRDKLNLPIDKKIYLSIITNTGDYFKLFKIIENTYEIIKKKFPDSYFIMIAPEKGSRKFINYYKYLNNLYKYFYASDFVITQTGYGKIIELSALRVPFISIPLDYHFEQEYIMNHRLNFYSTGKQVLLREISSEMLFDEINNFETKESRMLDVDDGTEVAKIIIDFSNNHKIQ